MFDSRGTPIHWPPLSLTLCRLSLLISTFDIFLFSATELGPSSANPIKADVQPLLFRCLLTGLTASTAFLLSLAFHLPSHHRMQHLSTAIISLLVMIASIHMACLLLSTLPPLSSALPTVTFAVHAALICLPCPSSWNGVSVSSLVPPLSLSFLPLFVAWLSSYWLVLDHDDKWQIWPLPHIVALSLTHTAQWIWEYGTDGRNSKDR